MAKKEKEENQDEIITLVGGTEKWNWTEESIFKGRPTGTIRYITDEQGEPRKDENGREMCLGHEFEDEDGEFYTLGDNYHINVSLNTVLKESHLKGRYPEYVGKKVSEVGPLMKIEFLGKKSEGGRQLNSFKVQIIKF